MLMLLLFSQRLEEVKAKEAAIEASRVRSEAKIKENLQKVFDEEILLLKEQRKSLEEAERNLADAKEKIEIESDRKILAAQHDTER